MILERESGDAMSEARKMLDQLMGKARNVNLGEEVKARHFSDPDVCKFHLCGLCPYEMFKNTRSDLGGHPEDEEDDDKCKEEYDKLSDSEKRRYGYEKNLLEFLRRLVRQCDQRIESQKARQLDTTVSQEEVERIAALERQMADLTAKSEALAEEGEIDEAQKLIEEVERLKIQKEAIANAPMREKRMIVCDISGNLMSSTDNDERIDAHFQGKLYIGWKAVRDKVAEIEERERRRLAPPPPPPAAAADRSRDRSRERDRDRDRNDKDRRDRSRDRRERDRDRDRDRKSDRRDRDRDRDHRKSDRRDRDRRSRRSALDVTQEELSWVPVVSHLLVVVCVPHHIMLNITLSMMMMINCLSEPV